MTPTAFFQSLSAARRRLPAAALGLLAAVLAGSCDVDSADSTTSIASGTDGTVYDFSGLYTRTGDDGVQQALVYPAGKQSGATVTWLRLLQSGSVLEGYDNAGMNWEGSISSISSATAQFNLQGRTTAGAGVEIAGALRYSESGSQPASTLDATWIEPSFAGSIYATATVAPASSSGGDSGGDDDGGDDGGDDGSGGDDDDDGDDGSGSGSLTISPTSVSLMPPATNFVTFTVSGGTSPYSWRVSDSTLGSLSATTGVSVVYTRTDVNGTNIIEVADSVGAVANTTVSY